MTIKIVKINELDRHYQTRFALNADTVEEYAEAMKAGEKFPPVTVVGNRLTDGYHRVAAAEMLGMKEIEAEIIEGDEKVALSFALSANVKHGLRRSSEDKIQALKLTWENRDTIFGKDNPNYREISEFAKVSLGFISTHKDLFTVNKIVEEVPSQEETPAEEVSERTLQRHLKAGTDRFGMPIPEKILSAFLSTEPKKIRKELKTMRKLCEQRIFGGDIAFVSLGQAFLTKFDNLINDITHWTPHCVCRACRGEGCNRCSNHGFQTKAQYERNPPELKA